MRACECSVAQSCPILCNLIDCSLPDSSVYGFPRQDYWSGWLVPIPGDLPDPGMEPTSLVSPALAGVFFATELSGKPTNCSKAVVFNCDYVQ